MLSPVLKILLAVLLVLVVGCGGGSGSDPAGLVDPFIGTGAHGHTFPGATLPFGMVQLSPDTRLEGWDGCSGYHFTDDVVYGFSHTHLSGTGISDYGDILFMPLTGEPHLDNGYETSPDQGYASRFDKASERAEPGWYAVHLADYDIDVELTATERTGLHRYRFPGGQPAWVVIDLTHRDEVLESGLSLVGDNEIEGYRRSTGWARDQVVHFAARFSKPFERAELAVDDEIREDATARDSKNVKARLYFGDQGGELLVRVGISAVDIDGARRNLEAEPGDRAFDKIRGMARDTWNRALGRIEIEGGTRDQREIFYTALYHAMIAPNVYSDVDGRYLGHDGRIHRTDDRQHYTVFSLWDTFRSAHPLYTLIEPERTREFIDTFLAIYEQGGRLPVWELAANETDTMIGYHAIPVITDAWVKGIRGFDAMLALEAMVDSATRDPYGLAAYQRQGFIGSEDDGESVSKTLEYAYDDWCIARLAEELEEDDLADQYDRRSQAWRHLLDPETGFMRARRNQRWVTPFDPARVDNHYTEANSWQYSFFVPHDVEGLMEALGGEERFVSRLDGLFEAGSETTGREQADITGLIGQYAHGNEPSHHMAWLYHYAGLPGESARRVRRIVDELYTAEPDGLSGNEDCGQMSSWYVWAAIGLYPVVPGSDEYAIGVPVFSRVAVDVGEGQEFVVRTQGASPGGEVFVESATLDGEPLTRSFLRHEEIVRGGELVLTLGRQPGEAWGREPKDRPRSQVDGPRILAAPFLRSESDRFRDSLSVELGIGEEDAEISFTHDRETVAPAKWKQYEGPIDVRESTPLRFFARRGNLRSPVVEAYLHRIPNNWTVELSTEPNPQYTAGGPLALIDGLRGNPNWRTGGWLGFQYTDFEATVDFGARRPVRHAGARFLQDQRSWIWMPKEVVISVSDDGIRFREVGRAKTDVPEDAQGVLVEEVVADVDTVQARYLRIQARSLGPIPDWHPGHGDKAFIFTDELLVSP
jgi:predicted alpha-1,2-mannosidase